MEKQADVNMTFESFVALYKKDIKPKLKLNTWLTKDSIIKKKILPWPRQTLTLRNALYPSTRPISGT